MSERLRRNRVGFMAGIATRSHRIQLVRREHRRRAEMIERAWVSRFELCARAASSWGTSFRLLIHLRRWLSSCWGREGWRCSSCKQRWIGGCALHKLGMRLDFPRRRLSRKWKRGTEYWGQWAERAKDDG